MDLFQSNEDHIQKYSLPIKNEYQKLMRNGEKTVKNHEVTIHNDQTINDTIIQMEVILNLYPLNIGILENIIKHFKE